MAAGSVLAAAGLKTAIVTQTYVDALTHNVLELRPGSTVGPPSVAHGNLGNTVGGRQTDLTKPERLSVLLGPRATLRGIVRDLLARTFVAGHSPQNPFDELRVVQGVYVYNRTYLEGLPAPAWRVGLWLPLPVEVDAAGAWTVNWDFVMASGVNFDPTRWAALDAPAEALALPDPDALPAQATAFLAGKDQATAASALVTQLVANPFDCVFLVYEIFRQLPAAGARSTAGVASEIVTGLTLRELTLLARVTAGNAVLRRLWSAIAGSAAAGAPAARDRLAPALGLAGAPGAWRNPDETGPTVVPSELPLRPALPGAPQPKPARQKPNNLTGEDPDGVHTLVLGRDLCVGNVASFTQKNGSTWSGAAYTGRIPPSAWTRTHANALRLTSTAEQARLDVVLKIAENEAYLDGSRAADKGTLSSAIQQWSIHLNDELPALLERFRVAAPDHYDLFFGLYGLQTLRWARTGPALGALEAPPTPPEADIRRDNPDAYTGTVPTTDPKAYDVAYATVGSLAPGGAWRLLPQPPDAVTALGPRHTFFGVSPRTGAGRGFEVSPTWVGRVRLAALCSAEYQLCQIWTGVYRFERLRRQLGTTTVDGVGYPPAELLRSEFAAAAALDQHVNAPFWVAGDVATAVSRTNAALAVNPDAASAQDMRAHDPVTGAVPHPPLRAPWLTAFAVDYLAVRRLVGKLNRDAELVKLHDAGMAAVPRIGLSAQPGSFLGW